MSNTVPEPIRLRPDGSIDTGHYLALARLRRSAAAMGFARASLGRRATRTPRSGVFGSPRS